MKYTGNIFLLLAFFLSHSQLYSQLIEWEKTTGTTSIDFPEHISLTSDNQLLVAGISESNAATPGDGDFWLVKIDSDNGEIIWDEFYGGDGFDLLATAFETADGGYILGGWSESDTSKDKNENGRGGDDYWVLKLDANRNIEWQRTMGGASRDRLTSMIVTPDGGYLLGGESNSDVGAEKGENSRGGLDIWLVKLDVTGNIEWEKTYGGQLLDRVETLLNASDGGYILAAHSSSNISGEKTDGNIGVGADYWIIKIDDTGSMLWQRTIGGDREDVLTKAVNTDDGGYLIGGSSRSGISGDKNTPINSPLIADVWLLKLDVLGDIVWQNTIGTNDRDWLTGIANAADGGFFLGIMSESDIFGPKTENSQGARDYWGVKIDDLGNILWEKTVGGSASDNPQDVVQTPDGGYVIAGWSDSNISGDKTENSVGGSRDSWLVKLRYCEPDGFSAASNSPVCIGDQIGLNATGGITYDWTGPNGFTSNLREPEIPSTDLNQAGTYTVTITVNALCIEILTTDVIIEESPTLAFLGDIQVCDEDDDGFFSWESTTLESDLLNGQQNITLEFYDAANNPLPYPFPDPYTNTVAGPNLITVRAFYNSTPGCTSESSFTLVPEAFAGVGCLCDEEAFSATSNSPLCIGDPIQLNATGGLTYAWTGPNGFTSDLSNPEIPSTDQNQAGIYTVTITMDASCNEILTTELILENSPSLADLGEIQVCDENEDGFFSWESTNLEEDLLNGQQNVMIAFYDTANNALPYPFPDPYMNTVAGPNIITVRAFYNNTPGCMSENSFTLVPEAFVGFGCICDEEAFGASTNSPICSGDPIELNATGGLSYEWTGPNGFTSDLSNPVLPSASQEQTGVYTVTIMVDDTCFEILNTEVLLDDSPLLNVLDEITVCDEDNDGFFSWESSTIDSELLNGQQDVRLEFYDGDYNPLPSPLPNPYMNDQSGPTTIRVLAYNTDGLGCPAEGSFVLVPDAFIGEGCIPKESVAFPKFFTPNGDGVYDEWRVHEQSIVEVESVSIFDRYGKLLRFSNGSDLSWNGIHNGREMPSDSYWFMARYITGKTVTGYFALKR